MIYFDNAATSYPKPQKVLFALRDAPRLYGANPGRSGHDMSLKAALKVYEAREIAAKLFHARQVEDVAFTQNCTQANNFAIKGILDKGDHVIISDLEHNSVLRPIHTLSVQGIITYSIAATYPDDDQTVASFRSLIRPNTRLIACTHASNVFGFKLPVREIGELAKEQGIFFLVDAAQTAGVLPIDVQENGIDFLCTSGHKSLYGPTGTGLMITSVGEGLKTSMEGGTGSQSASYSQPQTMPDRFESGTINTVGIIGLETGISYVMNKGLDTIYHHEMRVISEIHRRLSEMGHVLLYTPMPKLGSSLPVLSFNIIGLNSEETVSMLNDAGFALRGGLHCAPLAHEKMGTLETGTARISVGAFNTMKQAAELCAAIKKITA